MVSKPCARADRGCPGIVSAKGPKTLAKRRFCSHRCCYLHRVEREGWRPVVPYEVRRQGGILGGRASGETRRRLGALRIAERLKPLWSTAQTPREDLPRLKVLLVRAWRAGYEAGRSYRKHGRRKAAA